MYIILSPKHTLFFPLLNYTPVMQLYFQSIKRKAEIVAGIRGKKILLKMSLRNLLILLDSGALPSSVGFNP